jgi:dTDP-4-dehydrorhamnose reductase
MSQPVVRVLITGSNGLLGQKLTELFSHISSFNLMLCSRQDQSVFPEETLTYRKLDITSRTDVKKVIEEYEPDVIVNSAAITNVDACETEREAAWRINVSGVENIVQAAKLTGSKLIHVSTDYVFDGKTGPYSEVDRPNPMSYYGRTKLASENVITTSGIPHAIVRTMVLYGIGYGVKLNFALWLLRELSQENPVRVVDDQICNPTLADDLAYAILKIIELNRTGLYHVSGSDLMSRYEFAMMLARAFRYNRRLITPVKTASLKQPAARPLRSGFVTLKAQVDLGIKPSGVEQGLTIFKNQVSTYTKEENSIDQ